MMAVVYQLIEILILKIRKLKSVGGSIDSQPGDDQQSTQR